MLATQNLSAPRSVHQALLQAAEQAVGGSSAKRQDNPCLPEDLYDATARSSAMRPAFVAEGAVSSPPIKIKNTMMYGSAAEIVSEIMAHFKSAPPLPVEFGREVQHTPDYCSPTITEDRLPEVTLAIPTDAEGQARLVAQLADGCCLPEHYDAVEATVAANAGCSIPLQSVMPWFARNHTNDRAEAYSPNCFNAALSWSYPSTGIDGTSPERLYEALNDPNRFREVLRGEQPHLGDVIVIMASGDGPEAQRYEHALVYVSEGLVWHKAGHGRQFPWTFARAGRAFDQYKRCCSELHVRLYRAISPELSPG